MKYPLTYMLFLTILIVKEVLLVDTGAVTEVPVITTGPTHIVNTNKLQGIIHPSKAALWGSTLYNKLCKVPIG